MSIDNNKVLQKLLIHSVVRKKKKKSKKKEIKKKAVFLLYEDFVLPQFSYYFPKIKPQGQFSEGINACNSHQLQIKFCFEDFQK